MDAAVDTRAAENHACVKWFVESLCMIQLEELDKIKNELDSITVLSQDKQEGFY